MSLTDEITLVLRAQNMATVDIDTVVASLKEMEQGISASDSSMSALDASLLSLDASYQRVSTSAAAFSDVQARVASGALAGQDAINAQAAALGRLEGAMTSYSSHAQIFTGQQMTAAGIDPATGGVAGGTYGATPLFATPEAQAYAESLNTESTIAAQSRVAGAQNQVLKAQFAQQNLSRQAAIDTLTAQTNTTIAAPFSEELPPAAAAADASLGAAAGGAGRGLGMPGGAMLGYMAAYAAYAQLRTSIQNAAQESLTNASTVATTGLTADQMQSIDTALHGMIQGGQTYLPFTSLQQGVYPAASVMPAGPQTGAATLAIGTQAINLATAFNSPDVTAQATALIAPMKAMGLTPAQMVQQVPRIASMEYEAGVLGLAQPAQLAGPLSGLAPWIAQGVPLGALGGLAAYGTGIGLTPDVAGQDTASLLTNLLSPDHTRRAYFQHEGITTGQAAVADPLVPLQQLATMWGRLGSNAAPVFASMFDENTLKILEPIMQQSRGAFSDIAQVQGAYEQTGLASGGAAAVMASGGAQFQSAEQKFEDSLQHLGTDVLPMATRMIEGLSTAIEGMDTTMHTFLLDTMTNADKKALEGAGFRVDAQGNVSPFTNAAGTYVPLPPAAPGRAPSAMGAFVAIDPRTGLPYPGAGGYSEAGPFPSSSLAGVLPEHAVTPSGTTPVITGPGGPIPASAFTGLGAPGMPAPEMPPGGSMSATTGQAYDDIIGQGILARTPGGVGTTTGAEYDTILQQMLAAHGGTGTAGGLTAGDVWDIAHAQAATQPRGQTAQSLQLRSLQEALKTAELSNPAAVPADLAALDAFAAQNASVLYGNDPSALAYNEALWARQATAATTTIPALGPQLPADTRAGFGDPRASYLGAVTSLSGQQQQDDALRVAQEQLATLKQQNATLTTQNQNQQQQLRKDDKIIALLEAIANTATNPPAPAHPALASIRPPTGSSRTLGF